MRTINVNLANRSYPILIGDIPDLYAAVRPFLRTERLFVLTDKTVWQHHGGDFARQFAAIDVRTNILPPGEDTKSPQTYLETITWLLEQGITRKDTLLAFGGGVVGDLCGFCAATVLRGVPFIQVPTTLLAQIDSSVGGKTGINHVTANKSHSLGKNLIGAFHQPLAVFIDPRRLATLPDRVLRGGLAEAVKIGCVGDHILFRLLEERADTLGYDWVEVIFRCVDHKRRVVEEDETEQGIRATLNFGHTIGHAVEQAGKYKTHTHGEAVAVGMVAAARLGEAEKITATGTASRIESLLRRLKLPTEIPKGCDLSAISHDKKRTGGGINMIFLHRIGACVQKELERAKILNFPPNPTFLS